MTPARKILYCRCAFAKVVPQKVKDEMLARLGASERDFEAVPDLCEMSARKDPSLGDLAQHTDLDVVACYPRAVRWLFHASGHELPESARVLNMREAEAEALAAELGLEASKEVSS